MPISEERKQKEMEHYDRQAEQELQKSGGGWRGDFEGFEPHELSSYRFFYKLLKEYVVGKKVLDYGCGNGVHSALPLQHGAKELVGVDISKQSLRLAEEKMKKEGLSGKTTFLQMDCEKLEFPDNSFDIVMDGGTFSSLELPKALPEIARVLKPGGMVIGIETLGHNPIANLNRALNKRTGKRTEWAAGHIFQMKDFSLAEKYFKHVDAHFFHIKSFLLFPFANKPGGKILLKIAQTLEHPFEQLPLIRRHCFKTVFLFQSPKK